MAKRRVVVTGMGVVSCLGNDPDTVYRRLLNGESGVTAMTDPSYQMMPSRIAGRVLEFDPGDLIEKKQARRVDHFIAFALWAGKKALLSAGLSLDSVAVDPARAGVVIGSGVGGMATFFDNAKTFLEKGPCRVSPFLIPFILADMASALLAQDVGFMGPNYSVSTACATSNYAIIAAARHILNGDTDLMVCGGTEAPLAPIGMAGFSAMKALSERNDEPQRASRPFDKARDGFVIAEGAGILVLEELHSALRRGAPILAEYRGGGMSCDAYHMTEPRPDGSGVALCIGRALADAGVQPEQVSYINAHATSTPIGDMSEIRALEKIFHHPRTIALNATKSMMGHSLGAAGGIEAIATIQAIRTGYIHPTINLEDPEDISFDLPTEKKQVDIECAISNSFGFGGHNATVVFSPYHEC
jgi:3-oxoacyl-[acyl-carrier-protein] synthase II